MAYSPLDTTQNQIRLLHLAPADQEEDEIKCSFSLASLDEDVDYEALSYAWGDNNKTISIKIEATRRYRKSRARMKRGKRAREPTSTRVLRPRLESSVLVTENLHLALKHLRLKDRERTLWIDALCINQSDTRERTHQVTRMSSIYKQASSVVVWLGEAWNGSELAMECLQRFGKDSNLHHDQSLSPGLTVNGMGLEYYELRGHLIQFFDLPWWGRLWTVQEYALAQRVVFQCGKRLLSGELLRESRRSFYNHSASCCGRPYLQIEHGETGLSLADCFVRLSFLEFIQTFRETYSFLTIVALFSIRQVTDSRDKIYGMLGLATGRYARLIEPDYTRSPEQVFEAAALASFDRTGKLEFLSHLFGQRQLKLPSFVPDWTASISSHGHHSSHQDWLTCISHYKASGGRSAEFNLIAAGKAVTRGIIFDTIATTGPSNDSRPFEKVVNEMRDLPDADRCSTGSYNHTSETRETAFRRTMCGSMDIVTKDSRACFRRLRGLTDFSKFKKWQVWYDTTFTLKSTLYDKDVSISNQLFFAVTVGRRFITTEKDYIGFAPKECEKGDLVAVLPGGSVPYILRPEPVADALWEQGHGSSSCYTILGDSYIHGIMDGEAFDMLDESEGELQEIVLV
ncbi:hypothetical protein W97_06367 [Coniosporium apollinis CBS 100218]|uniref:Heterokaryon incompatibility domain-containing protein n=1 Tax=Coniosporium apollinis (strain CBS 100218) TaxID=1168221 RepID=R7YZC1_CONA1|nr:uncharacterized protein W97_06367 [Coniosporium apollinis CBS 100218]EON67114.1 hypothetical protein W97_06367 [Coniosporium apollinis CBS 100218]